MITNTVNSGQNCKIQLIRFFGDVSRKTGNGFSDTFWPTQRDHSELWFITESDELLRLSMGHLVKEYDITALFGNEFRLESY